MMEITSAAYADENHFVVRAVIDNEEMLVPVVSGNRHWQAIEAWVELGNAISPYVEPPTDIYWLYRSVFIRRMSEQEVQVMEAVLQDAATPAKLRMMFYAVDYFVSDDPLFAQLKAAVQAALGETRADELLAAE